MRSKGYKCYNYYCKGRVGDSPQCGEPGDAALSCQDRVVRTMTNADRIRAMSDEELANLLTDFANDAGWATETGRQICYKRYQKWIQQPAEEE